jgi:hypothetical protein
MDNRMSQSNFKVVIEADVYGEIQINCRAMAKPAAIDETPDSRDIAQDPPCPSTPLAARFGAMKSICAEQSIFV